jgi:hypothetical protein
MLKKETKRWLLKVFIIHSAHYWLETSKSLDKSRIIYFAPKLSYNTPARVNRVFQTRYYILPDPGGMQEPSPPTQLTCLKSVHPCLQK